MVFGLVVFVGGYWIARALQPDEAARAIFDDRSPLKRFFLASLMALTFALGLGVQAARIRPGAALAWLLVLVAWVVLVSKFLARLAPASVTRRRDPLALALERSHPSSQAPSPVSAEEDEIWRRAMRRPEPVSAEPFSRIPPPEAEVRRPEYPAEPDLAFFRLRCKRCGSVLTRPMREYHPKDATRGSFRTGRMIASGSHTRPTEVDVLPGDADNAYFFSRGALDGAAVPLTWNTKSEGCCGPEARGGPNVMCHGCGAWALFYNETCYSPQFFAGRPEEVELSECDPVERFTRPARAHDKEHWRKVALEQPDVIELASVMNKAAGRFRPRFKASGKALDTENMRGGAAKIDPELTLDAVCLLLEHALECASGVRLDSAVHGSGVRIRVLCRAPVDPECEATVPERARQRARALGGGLHYWQFPGGDFQISLDIPREPIPLKPVGPTS